MNGSAFPDPELTYRTVAGVIAKGARFAVPAAIVDGGPSAITNSIAKMLGTKCRTIALQSACCAGLDAIGHGADMIATGQAEIAFCCGTEAPLFNQPMIEFGPPEAFAAQHEEAHGDGAARSTSGGTPGVIGEGACVIILESEDSPRPAKAWVEGYAYSNDEAGSSRPTGSSRRSGWRSRTRRCTPRWST